MKRWRENGPIINNSIDLANRKITQHYLHPEFPLHRLLYCLSRPCSSMQLLRKLVIISRVRERRNKWNVFLLWQGLCIIKYKQHLPICSHLFVFSLLLLIRIPPTLWRVHNFGIRQVDSNTPFRMVWHLYRIECVPNQASNFVVHCYCKKRRIWAAIFRIFDQAVIVIIIVLQLLDTIWRGKSNSGPCWFKIYDTQELLK